jgi:hypothetical protein
LCLLGLLLCCRPLLDGCIGRSLEFCVVVDAEDIVSTLVAAMALLCCAFDGDAGVKASLVMVTQAWSAGSALCLKETYSAVELSCGESVQQYKTSTLF